MKRLIPCVWLLAPVLALAAGVVPAAAQTITTGSISGTVVDQQGGLLPGATATAVHVETGTTYSAVTQLDGRFSILNVRIGTYRVKATLSGFKEQEQTAVAVALGEERILSYKLELASLATAITVVGVSPPIDTTRAGAGANIDTAVKDLMPTISRSLTDITRTNMYFNPNGFNEDTPGSAVAGRSQRYNSIQIDGAVNTWALERQKVNGDSVDSSELFGNTNYVKSVPNCPAGGTYNYNSVGDQVQVECTFGGTSPEGHTLP